MKKTKIAIYGGTFNPPHKGHVEAARAFGEKIKPDKLLIMPSFIPPHKEYKEDISPELRIEMCRIAFSDVPGAIVSDMEIKRAGKSYTYLTLEELASDDTELYFLLGSDMLLTLDQWKNSETIFSLANICLIRRESDRELSLRIEEKKRYFAEKYGAEIIEIHKDVIEISSSRLRKMISEGEDTSAYLQPGVLDFIKNGGFYI